MDTPSPRPSKINLFKACASVPPFSRYRGICMENSVNVYIHTFISIYIYMYIYWYNWYTILSNPHKHCVSERATFSKSLVHCASSLVHSLVGTTQNRTNLSHFSTPIFRPFSVYHFRYLPSGTLFCLFFPLFALSAPSILNKLMPTLAALADVLSPTHTAGPGDYHRPFSIRRILIDMGRGFLPKIWPGRYLGGGVSLGKPPSG